MTQMENQIGLSSPNKLIKTGKPGKQTYHMAFRASSFLKALPKAPVGFGGRSSQGSNVITVFGGTGMTGESLTLLYLLFFIKRQLFF